MESIIQLAELTKCYGSLRAVDQLNLSIRKGEIYGLLGPNGAGKTTTILMMLGLTEPTAGTAIVCGINATRQPVAVKRKVGYMPDQLGFYSQMTALENLMYIARLNGFPEMEVKARAEQMMALVGLSDAIHKKTGAYSRGMKQRLGLADVLIREPEVIILDEPTLGIDPSGVKEFLALIRQLSRDQQITILLSSHHLHQVQQVCDRVGIFVGGKLIAEGDQDFLSRQVTGGKGYEIVINLDCPAEMAAAQEPGLRSMSAVKEVAFNEATVSINCTDNVTPALVRYFVQQGIDIMGVHKKEYALEDIYQRYFENNESEKVRDGKSSGFFKRSFSGRTEG